ncbi:Uncharacterised protein [Mycobacteroides abscessus subsp. abscessus]|nr:Uncharacterised protein [Mycobacteroides abscessus subsp. abscessus]
MTFTYQKPEVVRVLVHPVDHETENFGGVVAASLAPGLAKGVTKRTNALLGQNRAKVFHRFEVPVEGSGNQSGRLGHLAQAHGREATHLQQLQGSVEQCAAGMQFLLGTTMSHICQCTGVLLLFDLVSFETALMPGIDRFI